MLDKYAYASLILSISVLPYHRRTDPLCGVCCVLCSKHPPPTPVVIEKKATSDVKPAETKKDAPVDTKDLGMPKDASASAAPATVTSPTAASAAAASTAVAVVAKADPDQMKPHELYLLNALLNRFSDLFTQMKLAQEFEEKDGKDADALFESFRSVAWHLLEKAGVHASKAIADAKEKKPVCLYIASGLLLHGLTHVLSMLCVYVCVSGGGFEGVAGVGRVPTRNLDSIDRSAQNPAAASVQTRRTACAAGRNHSRQRAPLRLFV